MESHAERDQKGQDITFTTNSCSRSFSFERFHSHDPYPLYALARKEEPIFYSPKTGAWVVTRYSDVRSILLQPEIFSSRDATGPVLDYPPEVYAILSTGYPWVSHAVISDGTEHLRFRTPLNASFSPPRIKGMEPTIRTIANRLVDEMLKINEGDLVAQFTLPLPLEVIFLLFGLPKEDIAQCKRWFEDLEAMIELPVRPLSLERQIECAKSMVALQHYFAARIEERRQQLGDDVISHFLTIRYDNERPLSEAELVNALMATLMAGYETTTGLLGNGLRLLLSQPEHWQRLHEHPERIPNAVEEMLRYDTSVQTFFRTALKEARIGGVQIPEGALMLLVYGSANRDEAQFPEADQFDITRSPNRHLAFGQGVHFCAGAPLARLEGRIALEVLSQRLPQLRLKPNQTYTRKPSRLLRGYKALLAVWDLEEKPELPSTRL